jgi:hypothetical protein
MYLKKGRGRGDKKERKKKRPTTTIIFFLKVPDKGKTRGPRLISTELDADNFWLLILLNQTVSSPVLFSVVS